MEVIESLTNLPPATNAGDILGEFDVRGLREGKFLQISGFLENLNPSGILESRSPRSRRSRNRHRHHKHGNSQNSDSDSDSDSDNDLPQTGDLFRIGVGIYVNSSLLVANTFSSKVILAEYKAHLYFDTSNVFHGIFSLSSKKVSITEGTVNGVVPLNEMTISLRIIADGQIKTKSLICQQFSHQQ